MGRVCSLDTGADKHAASTSEQISHLRLLSQGYWDVGFMISFPIIFFLSQTQPETVKMGHPVLMPVGFFEAGKQDVTGK